MAEIQIILNFCKNPTFENFNKITLKNKKIFYEMAKIAIKLKIDNSIFITGSIIEYYSLINPKIKWEDALRQLPIKTRKILNNQYNKPQISQNNEDVSNYSEFKECLESLEDYRDESLCFYNYRFSTSNKWKALETRAIFLGFRPNITLGIIEDKFPNFWEKNVT